MPALSSSYSLLFLSLAPRAGFEGTALLIPTGRASPWPASPQHSVSDVELLLCRHKDLEKLLASQEEKFARLQQEAAVRGHREPGASCLSLRGGLPPGTEPAFDPWGKPCSFPCQLQGAVTPHLGGLGRSVDWDKRGVF